MLSCVWVRREGNNVFTEHLISELEEFLDGVAEQIADLDVLGADVKDNENSASIGVELITVRVD